MVRRRPSQKRNSVGSSPTSATMSKKVYYLNISDGIFPWVDTWIEECPKEVETDDQLTDWLHDSFYDTCQDTDYSLFVFTPDALDELIAKLQKLRDE